MADQGYRSHRNSSLRGSRRREGKGKKTSARRAVVLTLSLSFYGLPRRLQEQLQTLKMTPVFVGQISEEFLEYPKELCALEQA